MEQLPDWNPALFEELYCEHRRLVHSIALRMVGTYAEAEDITQQVFMKAWSRPGAFRGGNLAAWLTRLTHNLCVDNLRRRREVPLGQLAPETLAISNVMQQTPEDEVVQEMTAGHIRRALALLGHKERVLVHAAFIDGETHDQIAKTATLPLGTVKTRIRSGLRHLRALTTALR